MITGVNLGNWLVLEKWMSPQLFAGTEAEDETQLCSDLDDETKEGRLRAHRDAYVTEADFAWLAGHGFDAVRIPVPYFVFGGHEPYVGCVEHLDSAFEWAGRHGIRVLLDLHTVPDSQNGFDNGGLQGVCKWHLSPAKVDVALDVLERLTARYRDHPALWGVEALNEPVSPELWFGFDIQGRYPPRDPEYARGSEPVPTEFLRDFYRRAYERIRSQSEDVVVVFHDGFRPDAWAGFLDRAPFENIVLDTHLYLMELTFSTGGVSLEEYLDHVRDEFATRVRRLSQYLPVMVGEWCLEPMAPGTAGATPEARQAYHRALADAQLAAWDGAAAWFFWSYKLLAEGPATDGWDLRRSVELGYLPAPEGSGPG